MAMVSWFKEVLPYHQEPIMSFITVAIANGILAVAVVGALTYVCRIPHRLDRFARPKQLLVVSGESRKQEAAFERSAA